MTRILLWGNGLKPKLKENDSCMFYNKFEDEGWLFYNKFEDDSCMFSNEFEDEC